MIVGQRNSLIMLVLLGLSIMVYHVGLGILSACGMEPLPTFEFLYQGAFLCGVVWWLKAEAQSSPIKDIYCAGMLVGAAWPIIIPYHLLKTRGIRGLLPLFGLIATFVFAKLLASVIYLGFSGFPSH